MSKQILIIRKRITSLYYMVREIKWLITCEYNKLAQKEYKRRHDWVRNLVHVDPRRHAITLTSMKTTC